ncbi:ankyrin repeat domain-containing protein [Endozoicomonas lisbonensis]|uniref:Ankyrin repeat domain-containing protein n=1 Tax=Endozoicomonas lisbonensis TaxID=3120522 RepID=A0ABV2SCG4_9GAMM
MKDDHQLLMEAILGSNIPLIQKRLNSGCDINARNHCGETVLQSAVSALYDYKYKITILEYLLCHGADFTLMDEDRTGPLTEAVINMDAESLKLLLDHGADPNAEAGFTKRETLYDEAVDWYSYKHFDCFCLSGFIDEDIYEDHNLWLESLHQLAKDTGNPAPEHLSILRGYGAKFSCEIEAIERKQFLDALNPDMDVYTIHADEGIGEFLWHKDNGDISSLVGAGSGCVGDRGSFFPEMSDRLVNDCCKWMESYMKACMEDQLNDFDWTYFNDAGLSLAQRLKNELGSRAKVFYSKAFEDPTDDERSIEIEATCS